MQKWGKAISNLRLYNYAKNIAKEEVSIENKDLTDDSSVAN